MLWRGPDRRDRNFFGKRGVIECVDGDQSELVLLLVFQWLPKTILAYLRKRTFVRCELLKMTCAGICFRGNVIKSTLFPDVQIPDF